MFKARQSRPTRTHDIQTAVMQVRLECDIAGHQADTLEMLMLLMLSDRPSVVLNVEVRS